MDAQLLNVFLSHKKALDETRSQFLMANSEKKSPFTSKEESTLRKASGEADKRAKLYNEYLTSLAKPDVKESTKLRGKKDTENALKKFLDTWHSQLKPLFERAQVPLVR